MFQSGFLGTKAPFFMDFVLIIVALLPFLLVVAISFAMRGKYRLHEISQKIIFEVYVVVGYFEYGVRLGGGYDGFVKDTTVSHDYSLIVLILHIIIAVVSFVLWLKTLMSARNDSMPKHIGDSEHKIAGRRAFIGITLTSLSGIWVYLILFVY